jgi:hypothetical protein
MARKIATEPESLFGENNNWRFLAHSAAKFSYINYYTDACAQLNIFSIQNFTFGTHQLKLALANHCFHPRASLMLDEFHSVRHHSDRSSHN